MNQLYKLLEEEQDVYNEKNDICICLYEVYNFTDSGRAKLKEGKQLEDLIEDTDYFIGIAGENLIDLFNEGNYWRKK